MIKAIYILLKVFTRMYLITILTLIHVNLLTPIGTYLLSMGILILKKLTKVHIAILK